MKNNIKQILSDIKNGIPVIVIDNEDRENEGDIIVSAEKMTYNTLNFISKQARGLMCLPITEDRANQLNLNLMSQNNTDTFKTAFTVSIDSKKVSTGISIKDRLNTILDLVNEKKTQQNFITPGHMFPLIAKNAGVLERAGHTEASLDLMSLAKLKEVALICEILDDDGTMAKGKELESFAEKYKLNIISIDFLIKYLKDIGKNNITKIVETKLPTKYGEFKIIGYKEKNKEHIALVKGNVFGSKNVLTRIHSECFTGDVLESKKCDCNDQLKKSMKLISKMGCGIIIYLRQEGRGIGLLNKLRAYNLQEKGLDTIDANLELGFESDTRDYKIAVDILNDLGVNSVDLITSNPDKINTLKNSQIEVNKVINIDIDICETNFKYLKTKKERMGHLLKI